MDGRTLVQQIESLQALMDETFAQADAAREAEDFDEATRLDTLARSYESRLNRRKKFLQR